MRLCCPEARDHAPQGPHSNPKSGQQRPEPRARPVCTQGDGCPGPVSPEQRSAEGATRLQPRRAHFSRLPGPRRSSGTLSRPPARPAAPRPAAPLTRSPSGGPVLPLARSPARRPLGLSALPTPADAGLQNSGPALCDTAHQSPASAAGVLQSACERRGRAVRGRPLLGRRGRTGVQEGLSVRRGPDVDPLLLTWDQVGARKEAGERPQSTGKNGRQGGAPRMGYI